MKYFIRLFIIYANAIWFINIKINILSIKNRNRTQKNGENIKFLSSME